MRGLTSPPCSPPSARPGGVPAFTATAKTAFPDSSGAPRSARSSFASASGDRDGNEPPGSFSGGSSASTDNDCTSSATRRPNAAVSADVAAPTASAMSAASRVRSVSSPASSTACSSATAADARSDLERSWSGEGDSTDGREGSWPSSGARSSTATRARASTSAKALRPFSAGILELPGFRTPDAGRRNAAAGAHAPGGDRRPPRSRRCPRAPGRLAPFPARRHFSPPAARDAAATRVPADSP